MAKALAKAVTGGSGDSQNDNDESGESARSKLLAFAVRHSGARRAILAE
jgi:hypothetical protein